MMPDFHLFFWGLICHIDKDGHGSKSDHSAIIEACSHVPRIVFSKTESYRLAGNVTFNTPSQHALWDPNTFPTYVPSLRAILAGKLELGITQLQNADALFVQYPASDERLEDRQLRVCDAYPGTTIHRLKRNKGDARIGRVGRIHVLQVPTKLRGFTVSFDYWDDNSPRPHHKDRPVSTDSCVLIANAESRETLDAHEKITDALLELSRTSKIARGLEHVVKSLEDAKRSLEVAQRQMLNGPPNHFEHYSTIVDTSRRAIAIPIGKDPNPLEFPSGCCWVREYVDEQSIFARAATHSECGPTGWP